MLSDVLEDAERHLRAVDPALGATIAAQTLELPGPRGDYFSSLVRSIIGQQVSVAAARAIALRFEETTSMRSDAVVSLTDGQIKAIGLSKQKASYIRDLASHFVQNPAVYDHLDTLRDEEVITELVAVKGIGVWTAQMFLMFTLGRADVFAPKDVGLQRAMLRIYGWKVLPSEKELAAFAEQWKPYRTVASLHLWQSLNVNAAPV